MKKLVAITALVSGILLFLIPRYILPACEYLGYPHMHCSDTARAEFVAGVLLILVGGAAFFAQTAKQTVLAAILSGMIYVAAFRLPDTFGYCLSPRMPCNYGMVPGIRFMAVTGALIMTVAIIRLLKSSRKKGNP